MNYGNPLFMRLRAVLGLDSISINAKKELRSIVRDCCFMWRGSCSFMIRSIQRIPPMIARGYGSMGRFETAWMRYLSIILKMEPYYCFGCVIGTYHNIWGSILVVPSSMRFLSRVSLSPDSKPIGLQGCSPLLISGAMRRPSTQ